MQNNLSLNRRLLLESKTPSPRDLRQTPGLIKQFALNEHHSHNSIFPQISRKGSPTLDSTFNLSKFADSKLRTDKQKASMLAKTSRGTSHLLDKYSPKASISDDDHMTILGHIKKPNPRKLPTNIEELSALVNPKERFVLLGPIMNAIPDEEEEDIINNRVPAGRRDAEYLANWLDKMLTKVLKETNEDDLESLFNHANLIYTVCIKEIIRQVSIHCNQRGQLIKRVWQAYLSILEKSIRISQTKMQYMEERFQNEKGSIHKFYMEQNKRLEMEVKGKQAKIESLEFELKRRVQDLQVKDEYEEQLLKQIAVIQEHYKRVKKEVLILKEDNRIFQEKMRSVPQYNPSTPSNRAVTLQNFIKVKRKTDHQFEYELKKDPVLGKFDSEDKRTAEELIHDIYEHGKIYLEKAEDELFNQPDFKDAGTNPHYYYLLEIGIQTDVQELCGEQEAESRVPSKRRSSTLLYDPSADMIQVIQVAKDHFTQLDYMIDRLVNHDIPEEVGLLESKLQNLLGQDSEDVNELMKHFMNRKLSDVNTLFDQMRANMDRLSAQVEMNSNDLVASFAEGLKQLFSNLGINNNSSLSLESLNKNHDNYDYIEFFEHDENEDETKKKRLWGSLISNVAKKDKQVKRTLPIQLAQRIQSIPSYKLRNIMVKKMLMKYITVLHDELKSENLSTKEPGVYILEKFLKRFGMPKVAENKYVQLLSSIMKYKSIRRVQLFGRFLRLFEAYDIEDIEFYYTCFNWISNRNKLPPIPSYSEDRPFSFQLTVECVKTFVKKYISEEELNILIAKISVFKDLNVEFKTEVISFDDTMHYCIELNREKRYAQMDFLKTIYEAADVSYIQLNSDGFLQFHEIELLIKHISAYKVTPKRLKELFIQYSENFTSEEEQDVRAISFQNFKLMNDNFDIFTHKSLESFAKLKDQNIVERLRDLARNIEWHMSQIKWRFQRNESWSEYLEELEEILNGLKGKVKSEGNTNAVWVGYRLMEEESKTVIVDDNLWMLLPDVSKWLMEDQQLQMSNHF